MLYMVLATIMQCALANTFLHAPNAADAWREFFAELQDIPYIAHEDGFQMPYYENDEWDANAHALREKMSPLLERVREISAMEEVNWELDYSQGFDLLIPHVSQLREVQKMLRYSMLGEMDAGNTSAALADMHAMIGIVGHVSKSDVIISSLVSASGFALVLSNESLIDSTVHAEQLASVLAATEKFDAFDPFRIRANVGNERDITLDWLRTEENPDFSIFDSIADEQVDPSVLDMDVEIERYSSAMERIDSIFQMTNKDEAMAAAAQIEKELESGELGILASALSIHPTKLLQAAFRSQDSVSEFKQLLKTKMDMLRTPNASTFFLKAADAYNALDAQERTSAIAQGDFSVVEEPLLLFAKACSLPTAQITLAKSPATPKWVAPLYALALDCLARGTEEDAQSVGAFVGHMSTQNRFAASIVAGKLFGMLQWQDVSGAMKNIPAADAFGLHGSARSNRERLKTHFTINEKWEPSKAKVLALTFAIAKAHGVPDENPLAWGALIDAVGIPDNDPVITAILEEWMPESLQFIDLEQEPAFDSMLNAMRKQLANMQKTIRSRER
jgi:hypothetical protein